MAYRDIPDEVIAQALETYRQGAALAAAARKHGVHRETLARAARRQDIVAPRERSRAKARDLADRRQQQAARRSEACELIDRGEPVTVIVETTGLSQATVYRLRGQRPG